MDQSIALYDDDAETVLRYFRSEKLKTGYTGLCAINLSRLAEIHLKDSILTANEAIKKAQQSK